MKQLTYSHFKVENRLYKSYREQKYRSAVLFYFETIGRKRVIMREKKQQHIGAVGRPTTTGQ